MSFFFKNPLNNANEYLLKHGDEVDRILFIEIQKYMQ